MDPVLGDLSEGTTTNIDIKFVVDNYGQIIFRSKKYSLDRGIIGSVFYDKIKHTQQSNMVTLKTFRYRQLILHHRVFSIKSEYYT